MLLLWIGAAVIMFGLVSCAIGLAALIELLSRKG